jgi:hypothetical protein
MSTNVTWNGVVYSIPQQGDPAPWGSKITNITIALAQGALSNAGGLFTLASDVNFGATYGLLSSKYASTSTNIASSGVIRLAQSDSISFRNNANTADLSLHVNADSLTFPSFTGNLTGTATGFNGPYNGTVGATTPNTGVFTTVSVSGDASTTSFDVLTDTATTYASNNN